MRELLSRSLPALSLLMLSTASASTDSVCFGTTGAGRLEGACRLPMTGENFRSYSRLLWLAGRTWLHCDVKSVVLEAYESLAIKRPDTIYVYGETGRRRGGVFKPHRTHQNGLSVDFMVPVISRNDVSVPLPTHIVNRYGYSVEFTRDGYANGFTIDYEALASHLAALDEAARHQGFSILRVVFDPQMQPALKGTTVWPSIAGLPFSGRRAWVRHDEHYHVDFTVPCRSFFEAPKSVD